MNIHIFEIVEILGEKMKPSHSVVGDGQSNDT